ncbi:hypothetical protein [Roseateles chitinivorans]|uniref:hypothetical protein n=1 Tax=Roseateles chitinivorans TaxID=2917965 RepID=UPI003D67E161
MIERYLRAGVRFLWNKPPDNLGNVGGAIVASTGAATPLIYDGLDGHPDMLDPQIPRNPNVEHVLGIAVGATVPYAWLDYAPGRTAQKPMAAGDVLTGYMSGCLIARGTLGGATSAFHLGTIDSRPEVNRTVKEVFHAALPADATGFFPNRHWPPGEVQYLQERLGGTAGTAVILGLVTATGTFFSVLMFQIQEPVAGGGGTVSFTNPAGLRYWCVGGIKRVQALNRAQLENELR